ncbi:CIA30 family protein [Parvularcula lutaonensis]|uniref:CIA30 family protein n=1 Tax=Parvularcula lutaonensis TaxID=491923 RepID=A0ABV7MFI2_9PROT|nr:CIA30 family protein [Parvularcula lutaonensis]GGY54270.1 hypothetical protein GCM10007148_24790 [Parvularcula lutaonensis]
MMECAILDDFGSGAAAQWFTVNDGVMGGRSEGGIAVRDGALVFEGTINTNGGGFSSIRRQLSPGEIAGAVEIRLEAESDGRGYELILQGDARYRGRAVTYRAKLEPREGGLAAKLKDMPTTVFGRNVPAPPFDPAKAEQFGIILADGKDGPFRLAISKVEVCG